MAVEREMELLVHAARVSPVLRDAVAAVDHELKQRQQWQIIHSAVWHRLPGTVRAAYMRVYREVMSSSGL